MPNKYLSLSHILSPTLSCYNNRYAIKVFPYKQREKTVIFEGHTGTHVDVPYHVDETGKKITDYQLEDFIFSQVYMVAVTVRGNYVEAQDVSCVPENTDFLIINTGYSRDRAADKYALQNVGVSPEAIAVLRQKCKSFSLKRLYYPNFKRVITFKQYHISVFITDKIVIFPSVHFK